MKRGRAELICGILILGSCGIPERPPNVLLVSIDTLRADRLGVYGYPRPTSPALDRFAREHAVRFERAVAESPWTLPSHVTMLSGLHPWSHGVRRPDRAPGPDVEMLAETLAKAGYETFALTDGGWLTSVWGFDRGFHSFEPEDTDFDRKVADAILYIDWLEERGPWFGFLHTFDVHCPYDPPQPFFSMFESPEAEAIEVKGRCGNPDYNSMALSPGQVAYLSDRYDGGVRWVDAALQRLFEHLDERDLWRDTIVIVVSDHGEELGEHGRIGHEHSLHSECLAIPFLWAAPGLRPGTRDVPVGLADVVPTLLDFLGLEPRSDLDGRSLRPWLEGPPGVPQVQWKYADLAREEALVARTDLRTHAILDRRTSRVSLYDLEADPREQVDLCEENPERCAALGAELEAAIVPYLGRTRSTARVTLPAPR